VEPEVHVLESYLKEKPEKTNRPPVEPEVHVLESYLKEKPEKTNPRNRKQHGLKAYVIRLARDKQAQSRKPLWTLDNTKLKSQTSLTSTILLTIF